MRSRTHPAAARARADQVPAGVPAAPDRPHSVTTLNVVRLGRRQGADLVAWVAYDRPLPGGSARPHRGAHRRRAAVRRGGDQGCAVPEPAPHDLTPPPRTSSSTAAAVPCGRAPPAAAPAHPTRSTPTAGGDQPGCGPRGSSPASCPVKTGGRAAPRGQVRPARVSNMIRQARTGVGAAVGDSPIATA